MAANRACGVCGVSEEVDREHQRSSRDGGEEWQVRARLQADAEDTTRRQGQADHHRQQHPAAPVRTPPVPPEGAAGVVSRGQPGHRDHGSSRTSAAAL